MAEWEEVSGDPEYQALPQSEKDRVKLGFFKAEIEPHIDQAKAASLRHGFFAETSAQDNSGLKASLPERAVDALYGTGVVPQATKGLYEASTSFVPDKLKDLLAPGGRSAMESIRPPEGLLEKAAGWAGSGVGSLPNFIGAQGLAKGVLSKVAPRVAASAKMVPRMLKEGLAGALYTPAELTAQTGGESLKPENLGATAKATAIGAGAFAAFPPATAVGEKLIGTAIRAAQESGAFAFMRKKFPALFREAGSSVPQAPPEPYVPSAMRPQFKEGRLMKDAEATQAIRATEDLAAKTRLEAEGSVAESAPTIVGEGGQEIQTPGPSMVPDEIAERVSGAEQSILEAQYDKAMLAKQPGLLQRPIPTPVVPKPEPIPGAAVTRSPSPMPAPAVVPGQVPEPGLGPVPAEPAAMSPRVSAMRHGADMVKQQVEKVAASLDDKNGRMKMVMDELDSVEQTGTIPKEQREAFRKGGVVGASEAMIRAHAVSRDLIASQKAEVVELAREAKKVKELISVHGDSDTNLSMDILSQNLAAIESRLKAKVEGWTLQRFAVNRAEKAFAEGYSPDDKMLLQQAGVLSDMISKGARERLPITENLLKTLKTAWKDGWGSLSQGDKSQFYSDLMSQVRLNLFSPFSFSYDLTTNAAEMLAQIGTAGTHDLFYALKNKKLSAPFVSGWIRAIRTGAKGLNPGIEESLGASYAGEAARGRFGGKAGTFYTRRGPISTVYDYVIGAPLYAKGVMDTQAKRLTAMANLYMDGFKAADEAGIQGGARDKFVSNYVLRDASEESQEKAILSGKKAGFDRPLTQLEKRIASNPAVILFADSFPRWSFQMGRWGAEMLGASPSMLKKMATGKANIEETANFFTRTAAGWGGLYLLDNWYERMDFRSMDMIKDNGRIMRLSNRDPITTAYWALATIKGTAAAARGDEAESSRHFENAARSFKYASIPGSKLLSGEGGLLSSLLKTYVTAIKNAKYNPNTVYDEMSDTLNRLIPGQAVLGFAKALTDPTVRKGIGANIPVVSLTKEPVINPATGKPLKPDYRFAGIKMPGGAGTPMPGAEKVVDPVEMAFRKYGMALYRGPKSAIVGIPESDLPPEYKQEHAQYLGEARQQIIAPVVPMLEAMPREFAEKTLRDLDMRANQQAIAQVKANHMMELVQKMMQNVGKQKDPSRSRGMPGMWR